MEKLVVLVLRYYKITWNMTVSDDLLMFQNKKFNLQKSAFKLRQIYK